MCLVITGYISNCNWHKLWIWYLESCEFQQFNKTISYFNQNMFKSFLSYILHPDQATTTTCTLGSGVKQQPPMHQFRMRPFKPFWGWTKNTSSSPAQGFFSPLLCPKIFPSYLLPPPPTYLPPPTSLTSFPTHSISKARESSRAWVA
jgi:hypothetical protein